jgi:hypothetical protein
MGDIGRALVIFGVVIVVIGVILIFADRIPFIGRLPGDIVIRRRNVTFYFPVVTMILLSILLTIILNLFTRK